MPNTIRHYFLFLIFEVTSHHFVESLVPSVSDFRWLCLWIENNGLIIVYHFSCMCSMIFRVLWLRRIQTGDLLHIRRKRNNWATPAQIGSKYILKGHRLKVKNCLDGKILHSCVAWFKFSAQLFTELNISSLSQHIKS